MRRVASLILAIASLAALPAPAAAQDAAPSLTLDDAIQMALRRNRDLKVASYYPGIGRANLLVARGAFDPSLVVSRSYNETQFNSSIGPIPVNDQTKVDNYSAGVQGLLPTGTLYNLSVSTQEVRDVYNGISKNFESYGGFQVTQPLLQGFGLSANLVNVRIAKANRAIDDLTYRQSAIDTVTNVIIAYSNLLLAHDQLDDAQRAHALAQSLLTDNEKRYKVGSTSQSDVIAARAYAAQFDESVIIAERGVRDAQNALRSYIGETTFFEDEPLAALAPMEIPDVTIDRRADLERALTMRPDYQQQRLAIVKNRASESYYSNALLPQVNFVGGYAYNGSAETFSASRQMVEDHMNPSVAAGLTVTIPFTFSVGRGNLRAAKLTREQAEAALAQLQANIALSVATAEGQIETTRKRVVADQNALTLAKEALVAEQKKQKAGTSTTLAVVQQQTQVVQVEASVANALAAERQAVAAYDHELGMTLERYHIKLAYD
jgi:outer membrane protein TolC